MRYFMSYYFLFSLWSFYFNVYLFVCFPFFLNSTTERKPWFSFHILPEYSLTTCVEKEGLALNLCMLDNTGLNLGQITGYNKIFIGFKTLFT
jgi:hypothetical protein